MPSRIKQGRGLEPLQTLRTRQQ